MAQIGVVAPVYREDPRTLWELYERLEQALGSITDDFEILLVEDGAGTSWSTIRAIAERDHRVTGVGLSRNFGQHAAITAGLDNCDCDWVVVMDSDLQDRPEVIPDLYAKACEGHDVVFVNRRHRSEPWFHQFLGRAFFSTLKLLSGWDYNPKHGNFSIISRRVVEDFRQLREQSRFYGGMLQWLGFPRVEIDADHAERRHGESVYSFWKKIRLANEIIISYSARPLYVAVILGLIMSMISFSYGLYVFLYAVFVGDSLLPGWASVMVAIFFNSGIILIVLGVVGVYLGKTLNEAKSRPLYVVARSTELSRQATPHMAPAKEAETTT